MKKTLMISTLAAVLTTTSIPSQAAIPVAVAAAWPVIAEGAAWVAGFFLVTPTDELLVAGAAGTAGRAVAKSALKQAAKPKGPLVRTGPTAGQVRSRNADGRWRAKRSEAGRPLN